MKRVAPHNTPARKRRNRRARQHPAKYDRAERVRQSVERGSIGGPDHCSVNQDSGAGSDSRKHARPARSECKTEKWKNAHDQR